VLGVEPTAGPTARKPALVWPVTVTLAVTATASPGTPPRPLTWNDRGAWLVNWPARPFPNLESRTRAGSSGTNVAPAVPATK
jgi:hypothetical protein